MPLPSVEVAEEEVLKQAKDKDISLLEKEKFQKEKEFSKNRSARGSSTLTLSSLTPKQQEQAQIGLSVKCDKKLSKLANISFMDLQNLDKSNLEKILLEVK